MAEAPCWLTIIGVQEDGHLPPPARAALDAADSVFGAPRHLALVGVAGTPWPVPFSVEPLLARRGRKCVALVSGDPFWFGAGTSLTRHLAPGEWVAIPAPSAFALACARLGWALEDVVCLGLHAAPLEMVRPHLNPGARLLVLLRDGAAVAHLAQYLAALGFGASTLHGFEALGGPRERRTTFRAESPACAGIAAPCMAAIEVAGASGLPRSPGLPDDLFRHDGQITKGPIRALTLSALAPRPGAHLWDIGAGSGSVSVEWCLAGGTASAVEQHAARCANIRANAAAFGLARRLTVVEGAAKRSFAHLPAPDAAFVGGGADAVLLAAVWAALSPGGRLVVNAVTLETESLLMAEQANKGGALLRIDIASMAPLGGRRGWQPARPIVQWSATK